jgi:hypothetical protein
MDVTSLKSAILTCKSWNLNIKEQILKYFIVWNESSLFPKIKNLTIFDNFL